MNGSSRKNQLKALFGAPPALPEGPSTQTESDAKPQDTASQQTNQPRNDAQPAPAPDIPRPSVPRSASGAVKAMGLSLGDMSREIENARRLSESLVGAERIIELDPSLIDASFVEDRLTREDQDDPDFATLMESLSAHGQQVPILVRPHPDKSGHYQAAYGHRRMRAAARLGLRVKTIVRDLSDTDLVLAQGKENSERRDLSFIERALFAYSLIERGFERATVQDALSLHKAEMTRFLQVSSLVPAEIIRAVGPAPKIGRPRWQALAEHLKDAGKVRQTNNIIGTDEFKTRGSDERFDFLLSSLTKKASDQKRDASVRRVNTGDGAVIAQLSIRGKHQRLDMIDNFAPGFSAFVAEALPGLLERFKAKKAVDD